MQYLLIQIGFHNKKVLRFEIILNLKIEMQIDVNIRNTFQNALVYYNGSGS